MWGVVETTVQVVDSAYALEFYNGNLIEGDTLKSLMFSTASL